jgi:hypothetical protein
MAKDYGRLRFVVSGTQFPHSSSTHHVFCAFVRYGHTDDPVCAYRCVHPGMRMQTNSTSGDAHCRVHVMNGMPVQIPRK